MHTVKQLKSRADRLRDHLKLNGVSITRALSLECQAVQEGARDWNTLSAISPKDTSHRLSKQAAHSGAPTHYSRHLGHEHLIQYVGKVLPKKAVGGLAAEIAQIETSIHDYGIPSGHGLHLRCCSKCPRPHAYKAIEQFDPKNELRSFTCKSCGHVQDPLMELVIPAMLINAESFAFWLSKLSVHEPILGYQEMDVAKGQNQSILEHVCRSHEYVADHVKSALAEFGLESMHAVLPLGYYADRPQVVQRLAEQGVGFNHAKSLGWLTCSMGIHGENHESQLEAEGLVCGYLHDPAGGAPAFWGYRPRRLRTRSKDGARAYTVGDHYPRDAIYLEHLMDDRPLLVVDGFLHAIALRQAGVNAVAVPYINYVSTEAIKRLLEGRTMVVVCGHAFSGLQSGSETVNRWKRHARMTSTQLKLKVMPDMSTFERTHDFELDSFLTAFIEAISQDASAVS